MGLTTAIAQELLLTIHPTTGIKTLGTLTITAPVSLRIMTANGNATTPGTELASGGSYVAGTGLPIGANWAAPSGSSQSSNAAISQANMPAASSVGVELWDASGTPKRLEWGSMSTKTTQLGDTLTFTSGAITSAFA